MINGIINIYKEKGFTSHDVVAKLRTITKQKKIGHTGTLDPDAEGVLPVCFGKATRLCDMLTDNNKTYETVLLLGKSTDTQDITGAVLEDCNTDSLTEEAVKACILGYEGEYDQLPPMYSALKVNGKKLYELAREGIEVERKTRRVTIHQIEILEMRLPRVRMRVSCSKGTYIRTLCHDIGKELGCGGCMESLLRTRVGKFELKDSHRLEEIACLQESGSLGSVLVPVDAMFGKQRALVLSPEYDRLAYNGNAIPKSGIKTDRSFADGEQVRIYDSKNIFTGIFRYSGYLGSFRPEKMFYDPKWQDHPAQHEDSRPVNVPDSK